MAELNARNAFLDNVRRALGRPQGTATPVVPEVTALSQDEASVAARARSVSEEVEAKATELMTRLQESAARAGWKVARVASFQEAARYIGDLAREKEARSVVRSRHPVLEQLDIEAVLSEADIEVGVMAFEGEGAEADREGQRRRLRQRAVDADMGVTGVDYAIAETGTAVLLARKGVSRLVSLLPPVHVAVVELGQILPSLDELFTLQRRDFLDGSLGSYMTLITGPSRSADIEYTLVTGVHGPGDVHMVLVG